MEKIDVLIILLVVLAAIAFIIFLIKRNQKDKKDLVQKLNENYKKPKEHDAEIDYEE